MFDIEAFEKRLNTDPKFQEAFLLNPDIVLRAAGVKLSPEQAHKLRMMTGQAKMGQHIKVNLELNFIKLKDPNRYQINFGGSS